MSDGDAIDLVAHRLQGHEIMPLVPAEASRVWMDGTRDRFAYRCLPLKIANEHGWWVLSGHTVLATWDGGPGADSVRIEHLDGPEPVAAVSHFGHGVLTWQIPYLFTTSHGVNLLLRGPANLPKDGITALEGIVETDWTAATATMNWKLTRPGLTVRFDIGEPVCMILPVGRGVLERVVPRIIDLVDAPDVHRRHQAWSASRAAFLADLPARATAPRTEQWQKDYFHGRDANESTARSEHQRKLRLRPFGG